MRRLLVAGNWKMHGSKLMTAELISGIVERIATDSADQQYEVLVCPPSPYLAQAAELAIDTPIKLGAQNVNQYQQGAFTGEISLGMLSDLGCSYVLLGHSERRDIYGESDQLIADKFAACLSSGIIPVLCVGETLEQRQAEETERVVAGQINAVIEQVGIDAFAGAVIAYEPVWAIGTGETATPDQAQAVHAFIRTRLAELNENIAAKTRILYGGSMKPSNAEELLAQPDIDGGLIGGASLDAESFAAICEAAQKLA